MTGSDGGELTVQSGIMLGDICNRLTKIETILEEQRRTDMASSLGPRLHELELKFGIMSGKMIGIGTAAAVAIQLFFKFL